MGKKYTNFTAALLTEIGKATGFFEWPPEGTETWRKLQLRNNKPEYYKTVYRLIKQGSVVKRSYHGKQFLRLTAKGELKILAKKMKLHTANLVWDGKWRIAIFDIPEEAKAKRDQLRLLLKQLGFVQLQASVYICPYPLNQDAVRYLETSKLINYIILIRADNIGDDENWRKKFNL